MTDLNSLYSLAEQFGIDVDWFLMAKASSLSAPLPDGTCCIAMDPWKLDTVLDEIMRLAHELGHCIIGSFYNQYAALDLRQKHENRANKWAIEYLIPGRDLAYAVSLGHYEVWDLAEYFNVTEEFMRMAYCWYRYGSLAVDTYLGAPA